MIDKYICKNIIIFVNVKRVDKLLELTWSPAGLPFFLPLFSILGCSRCRSSIRPFVPSDGAAVQNVQHDTGLVSSDNKQLPVFCLCGLRDAAPVIGAGPRLPEALNAHSLRLFADGSKQLLRVGNRSALKVPIGEYWHNEKFGIQPFLGRQDTSTMGVNSNCGHNLNRVLNRILDDRPGTHSYQNSSAFSLHL